MRLLILFCWLAGAAMTCNKDGEHIRLAGTKWRVVSMQTVPRPEEPSPAPYTFTFEAETVAIKLDVNQCGGDYDTSRKGRIRIDNPACTEACCDSPFATEMAGSLHTLTHYRVSGDTLKLYNEEGRIITLVRSN